MQYSWFGQTDSINTTQNCTLSKRTQNHILMEGPYNFSVGISLISLLLVNSLFTICKSLTTTLTNISTGQRRVEGRKLAFEYAARSVQ